MGVTEEIVRFIYESRFEELSDEAVRRAKDVIADAVGVMLAGSREEGSRILRQQANRNGGRREATVVAGGFKTSPAQRLLSITLSRDGERELLFLKKVKTFGSLALTLIVLGLIGAPGLLTAAESPYPNKPIAFITHSGPGGGMDTMLRRMADILAKEQIVTQPIRVENVQGGSGAKAMTALVKRKGDGHVLAGLTSVWISAPLISPDLKVS
jgi:hypothetical protein